MHEIERVSECDIDGDIDVDYKPPYKLAEIDLIKIFELLQHCSATTINRTHRIREYNATMRTATQHKTKFIEYDKQNLTQMNTNTTRAYPTTTRPSIAPILRPSITPTIAPTNTRILDISRHQNHTQTNTKEHDIYCANPTKTRPFITPILWLSIEPTNTRFLDTPRRQNHTKTNTKEHDIHCANHTTTRPTIAPILWPSTAPTNTRISGTLRHHNHT
eukprot:1023840_1